MRNFRLDFLRWAANTGAAGETTLRQPQPRRTCSACRVRRLKLMTRRNRFASHARLAAVGITLGAALTGTSLAAAGNFPITEEWRNTARKVADAGVPLSELAPNAPDSYTVKSGDTLWGISGIFLKSPWRWPELWGMNLEEIRNPHLIYPGQVLFLEKTGDRARLRVAQPVGGAGAVQLSPRARASSLDGNAIPAIPLHLIEPFLKEAVVFSYKRLGVAA